MHFGHIKTLYGLYLWISIQSTSTPLHLKVFLKILSIWPNELDIYFLRSRKFLRRKEKLNNFLSCFPGKLRSLNCLFGRCADEVSVMTCFVTLITFLLHCKLQFNCGTWLEEGGLLLTAIYDILLLTFFVCQVNSCFQKIRNITSVRINE